MPVLAPGPQGAAEVEGSLEAAAASDAVGAGGSSLLLLHAPSAMATATDATRRGFFMIPSFL